MTREEHARLLDAAIEAVGKLPSSSTERYADFAIFVPTVEHNLPGVPLYQYLERQRLHLASLPDED
jgi:hypothetical protein